MAKERATAAQRRAVFARAQGRCEYCCAPDPFVRDPFTVEHIIPFSKGGKTQAANLALSCASCNGHKYNKVAGRDPLTGTSVLLFHPRQQQWHDHFVWSEDSLLIAGLTPTGRATVATLQLNHQKIVNLRRLLLLAGLHPPK